MFEKFINLIKHTREEPSKVYDETDAIKFYALLNHYEPSAPNIAVLGDRRKYKNLIKHYQREYDLRKGGVRLVIGSSKMIFMADGMEVTVLLIENYKDLYNSKLKFRKYL